MKRTGLCPKCRTGGILRLAVVGDATEFSGTGDGPIPRREGRSLAARRIAIRRVESTGGFFDTASYEPVAETEAYVCPACGYLEEYVKDPASVPWAEVEGATVWTG